MSFRVRRRGEVDEPDLEGFVAPGVGVVRVFVTLHTTSDINRDGEMNYEAQHGTWDVWVHHWLRMEQEPEKYVVFYTVPRAPGAAVDLAIFRRALNRRGVVFVPIRPRDDRWGLNAVMMCMEECVLYAGGSR
ncbi:hypothetical protein PsYK624_117370 [Phanerochaete sordida]|uniref:Uncharacterized protein n=1 Tax=Phanerochaete sordida TaxID=48140 RepID=A0A9P3GIS9_9APHY|nr:hypothetical protein PsYK624_117370 [Phanerochaete sordida]